ncbi:MULTISPECIES: hypothetical protein [unclassified Streptomyces]|uniref:hypothetical protein n=1 Tax=unclassified Streptomyces TaxID=2593676 RepID=UPI003D754AC2
MAGSSSACVAGLTAAALATVGFLAWQAAENAPERLAGAPAGGDAAGAAAVRAPRERDPAALPARSGTGRRVVYSLGGDRVWLVGSDGEVVRTFRVYPGTVEPAPGGYRVTSRAVAVTGTDGAPVEHVVRFTSVDGLAVGFSAAVSGSTEPPLRTLRTGAIRETREDGAVMWDFATIRQRVVVIR